MQNSFDIRKQKLPTNPERPEVSKDLLRRFSILKKCRNKFDCLVNEMLFITDLKPTLNVQNDSIRAKIFL